MYPHRSSWTFWINESCNAPTQRCWLPAGNTERMLRAGQELPITELQGTALVTPASTAPPLCAEGTGLQFCLGVYYTSYTWFGARVWMSVSPENWYVENLMPEVMGSGGGGAFGGWLGRVFCSKPIRIIPLPFPVTVLQVEADVDWPVIFRRKSAGRRSVF